MTDKSDRILGRREAKYDVETTVAQRDRERLRAEAAESRVKELEAWQIKAVGKILQLEARLALVATSAGPTGTAD